VGTAIASLILGVLTLAVALIVTVVRGWPQKLAYHFQTGDQRTELVCVEGLHGNVVELESTNGKFTTKVAADEFFARCTGVPIVLTDKKRILFPVVAIALLYVLAPGIYLALRLRDNWTNRKLKRLLGSDMRAQDGS